MRPDPDGAFPERPPSLRLGASIRALPSEPSESHSRGFGVRSPSPQVTLGTLRVGVSVVGVCGNPVRWPCSVAILVTTASADGARPFVTNADAATYFMWR